MKVRELIEQLSQFDGDLEVELMWTRGAEPGPVSRVRLETGGNVRVEIRGQRPLLA